MAVSGVAEPQPGLGRFIRHENRNDKQKVNRNGKKVPEGFSYSSDNNTEWLSVEDIRELLKTVELEK